MIFFNVRKINNFHKKKSWKVLFYWILLDILYKEKIIRYYTWIKLNQSMIISFVSINW